MNSPRPTPMALPLPEAAPGAPNLSPKTSKNYPASYDRLPETEDISANDTFMSSSNIDSIFLNMPDGADDKFYPLGTDFRDFLGNGLEWMFDQTSED